MDTVVLFSSIFLVVSFGWLWLCTEDVWFQSSARLVFGLSWSPQCDLHFVLPLGTAFCFCGYQPTCQFWDLEHLFRIIQPSEIGNLVQAEFILALAGSHGKSWSTTSSPRPAASVPDSASEGSLSALEKEKTVQSHGGSVSGRRSLPLSTDVQTLLRGYANAGNGTGCPSWPFPLPTIHLGWVNVVKQATAGAHLLFTSSNPIS
jgi:hypothetical protein